MPIVSSDLFHYWSPARTALPGIRTIPGPPGVSAPATGARLLGGAADKAARDAEAFGRYVQSQTDENSYGHAVSIFHVKRTEAEIQAGKMDPGKATGWLQDRLRHDASEIAGRMTGGKAARERFNRYAAILAAQSYNTTMWAARKRQVDKLTAGLFEDIDTLFQVLNRRPQDWRIVEREMIRRVDEGTRNHILNPLKAQAYKKGLQEKIDEARAKALIADAYGGRIDPADALARIHDSSRFTRLDPVTRQSYALQMEKTADFVLRRDIQRQEREERMQEREEKRRQAKNYDRLFSLTNDFLVGTGDMTERAIEALILQEGRDRGISGPQAHSLLSLLGMDDPAVEDPAVIAETYEGITSGVIKPEDIGDIHGITRATKRAMTGFAVKYREADLAGKAEGYRALIKSFMPVYGDDRIAAAQALAKAYMEFEGIMDNQRREGREPDPRAAAEAVIAKYGDPSIHVNAQPNLIIRGADQVYTYRPTLDKEKLLQYGRQALDAKDEEAARRIELLLGLSALRDRTYELAGPGGRTRREGQQKRK